MEHIGVIIVDHGSKRDAANSMLECVAGAYKHVTGAPIVEYAHMELAAPGIPDAFARCVAQGARHVVVALFFLSPGRHSMRDIPAMAAEAAAAHPGVTFSVTAPMGADLRLAEIMHDRVSEALRDANVPASPA